jgi:hypothetical protein
MGNNSYTANKSASTTVLICAALSKYSVLQYIGPAADAAKYKYKVEFFNKDRMEILAVTLLAGSFIEDRNSGNCVKLYADQYNRFENDRIGLIFLLEIIRV